MKLPNILPQPCARNNRGLALITVLVLLVIVTLLAISAGRNATQGELMARASRARQISLQAAEAALRDARMMLAVENNLTTKLNFVEDGMGVAVSGPGAIPGRFKLNGTQFWKDPATQWITRGTNTQIAGNPVTQFFTDGSAGVAAQPGFIVETVSADPDPSKPSPIQYFRITARGYGPTLGTVTFVQETVVRQTPTAPNAIPE